VILIKFIFLTKDHRFIDIWCVFGKENKLCYSRRRSMRRGSGWT